HDDAAWLDREDHSLPERRMDDVVADPEGDRRVSGSAVLPGRLIGSRFRVGQLERDLVDEARRHVVGPRPVKGPGACEGHVQLAPCSGDPDVAEPALLFEIALVDRASMRENPFLTADDEHDWIFE